CRRDYRNPAERQSACGPLRLQRAVTLALPATASVSVPTPQRFNAPTLLTSVCRLSNLSAASSCPSSLRWSCSALIPRSAEGKRGLTSEGRVTVTSGVMPLCQKERRLGVSHSSTASSRAEPSDRRNRCSTVPVPKVVPPTSLARCVSWKAPATISAALAEPSLTKTTSGRLVATPPLSV